MICKECGKEIVFALTRDGSKIALDAKSEKRYVRVDVDLGDPVVSLRDTYTVHSPCPKLSPDSV
jgi:hypothetical protein